MIIKGAKYVCDCCGKEVFVEQTREPIEEELGSFIIKCPRPEGWVRNEDGTFACEECAEK